MLQLQNMIPGEKVEMVIRRHWIVYVMMSLYLLVGILIAISIFAIFGFHILAILFMIIFWMFFSIFIYIEWLNHELDMFIITSNRIIGTDQVSFLNRNVAECVLSEVQQTNSHTKGFFSNVLNYGNIIVQTAGSRGNIEMAFAPDSMQNARKILNMTNIYKDKKYIGAVNNVNPNIAEVIDETKKSTLSA